MNDVLTQQARLSRRSVVWLLALVLVTALVALAVAESPLYLGAATFAAVFGFAVARWPWIAYAAMVASVPAQELGALPAGSTLVTVTQVSFPVAVAAFLLGLLARGDRLRLHIAFVPFALLLCCMLVSALGARSGAAAMAETARWVVAFAAFILALQFLAGASKRTIMAFIGVMAAGGVFEATFGVTQSLLALGPESFQLSPGISRAFGTFGHPNSYAGYLAMVFFPVTWVAIYCLESTLANFRHYRERRVEGMLASQNARHALLRSAVVAALLTGSAVIILGGILASYSRGAWLGIAAGVAVTLLLYRPITRYIVLLGLPLAAILLFGGFSSVVPASVADRLDASSSQFRLFDAASIPITDENFAAAERMAHWQAGWHMFEENPVLGIGVGNFNERYEDFFVREEFRFSRGHAHNYYIHTLAETGLLGLLAYLWLIVGLALVALHTALMARSGFPRLLALGVVGTMTAVAVHNFFENLHVLNLGINLSLIWALGIVAQLMVQREAASDLSDSRPA